MEIFVVSQNKIECLKFQCLKCLVHDNMWTQQQQVGHGKWTAVESIDNFNENIYLRAEWSN